MDSLPLTLLVFSRASSPIEHFSATILLPNSPTNSLFSFSNSLYQFMPLPISFLTAFYSPPFLTYWFLSSINNPFSFQLYIPSTFPANALFLSIGYFSIPVLLHSPYFVDWFLSKYSNPFHLQYWALSILFAVITIRHPHFPSCWQIYPSGLQERLPTMLPVLIQWLQRWWTLNNTHPGSSHHFECMFPRGGPR